MSSWEPIETAPKDGTEIIGVFSNDYGYQKNPTVYGPWTIMFNGKSWVSSWDGLRVIDSQGDRWTDYRDPDIEPTHWMPMPALPGIVAAHQNPIHDPQPALSDKSEPQASSEAGDLVSKAAIEKELWKIIRERDDQLEGAVSDMQRARWKAGAIQTESIIKLIRALPAAPKAQPDASSEAAQPITMTYRNWRGEVADRTVTPKRIWWGSTKWHPLGGWLMTAFDHEKQADRDFALSDADFLSALPAARAEVSVVEAAGVLLDKMGGDWGRAVNAMTPILRDDHDETAWNTVSEMRDAFIAALRALTEAGE